jgi:hypothetical protein
MHKPQSAIFSSYSTLIYMEAWIDKVILIEWRCNFKNLKAENRKYVSPIKHTIAYTSKIYFFLYVSAPHGQEDGVSLYLSKWERERERERFYPN